MSCGVGHRQGLVPALLWLWHKPAAVAQPLAWELPCAANAALKRKKKKKSFGGEKKKKERNPVSLVTQQVIDLTLSL